MMLYNPTNETITRKVKIPLYYTGLTEVARVLEEEGPPKVYKLNRDYTIDMEFSLGPDSYTWFVIQ